MARRNTEQSGPLSEEVWNHLPHLPRVALVGRPNVGKSALFNRIIGRRESIVHEESGVTRDRVERVGQWGGRMFRTVDTAGMNAPGQSDSTLPEQIQQQVQWAIQESDVLVQVVDVQAGVTPLDQMVADHLRRAGKPVILGVNKVDNPQREENVLEFHALGLDPLIPISALHGGGVADLMDLIVDHLPPVPDPVVEDEVEDEGEGGQLNPPDTGPLKLVVVGRPNAGKSSLVNALVEEPRVLVSEEPCTTRDAIDIPLTIERRGKTRSYLLIDTAGLRRTAKIDQPVEYYGSRRSQESLKRADLALLVLDASEGVTRQDQRIARMIVEAGVGCVVVLNKADLLRGEGALDKAKKRATRELPFLAFAPITPISALKSWNLQSLLTSVDRVSAQIIRQVTTSELNRVLERALEKYQAPLVFTGRQQRSSTGRYRQRPKVAKVYYATQVGIRPLRFRLFVNDKRAFSDNYLAYLTRKIREHFRFERCPHPVAPEQPETGK